MTVEYNFPPDLTPAKKVMYIHKQHTTNLHVVDCNTSRFDTYVVSVLIVQVVAEDGMDTMMLYSGFCNYKPYTD